MHRFRPEYNEVKAAGSGMLEFSNIGKIYTNDLLWAREAAVFGEDDWNVLPSLRLNAGGFGLACSMWSGRLIPYWSLALP